MEAIGIDETSRKGHRYITVVADLVERNVICVVPGKDSTTIKRFARDFMDHNGDPDRVRLVTCDMSLGFAKGIRERLPNAASIIDKFHVIKHANEAVDKVRKQEARGNALLKRTKYLWLRNESNLTGLQLETKRSLQRRRLKTGRACQMRETLCISSSRCFVFSHVFFSGLGSCMHFPYFSGCAEVFLPNMRASLTRRLWPVNSRSRPWCTMRSMIAAASLSSAKTVPHLLNSMFVVNMMLRLS